MVECTVSTPYYTQGNSCFMFEKTLILRGLLIRDILTFISAMQPIASFRKFHFTHYINVIIHIKNYGKIYKSIYDWNRVK
jgi:hypothetical protein